MTRTVDFDAFRAEQKHESITITVGGKSYPLPSSLPASLALDILRLKEEMGDEKTADPSTLMDIGAGLFGGKDAFNTVLREAAIGLDELPDLIRLVIEAYQVPGPNSTAPETEGA